MKRLSLYLFLILFTLQTPSQADDIRDLQIEGMSVGDSLLDYFSEEEIIKEKLNPENVKIYAHKKSKTFAQVGFSSGHGHVFNTYKYLQIMVKNNDKNYIIHGISGKIFEDYDKNIETCYYHQDKIIKEFKEEFTDIKSQSTEIIKHTADKSGKSTVRQAAFFFKNSDVISVECYYWHKGIFKNNFKITVAKEELNRWWYSDN